MVKADFPFIYVLLIAKISIVFSTANWSLFVKTTITKLQEILTQPRIKSTIAGSKPFAERNNF